MNREPWLDLLGSDPRPWLLESDEPAARWVALTHLFDLPADASEVEAAHAAVLEDPGTLDLVGRLGRWGDDTGASGHHSPKYQPNLLQLLADMGVRAGDFSEVDAMVGAMLDHQNEAGHFQAFGKVRNTAEPVWTSLLCDTHVITEVLVRYGRGTHPAVARAVTCLAEDLAETEQGRSWRCIPDPVGGFRGPGRKGDFCPQVTLEALRTLSRLPSRQHPAQLLEVARVAVRAWRVRRHEKPCSVTGPNSRRSSGPPSGTTCTGCSTRSVATRVCGRARTQIRKIDGAWPKCWPVWWHIASMTGAV